MSIRIRFIELLAAIACVAVLALLLLPTIRIGLSAAPSRTCQATLMRWGAIFAQYRGETSWYNPVVHGFEDLGPEETWAGCDGLDRAFDFIPHLPTVFPDYANDPTLLACPEGPGYINGRGLGPVTLSDAHIDADVFGVVRQGAGRCDYVGNITNGDASYTYLGYIMNKANDDDPVIDAATAKRLGLPATGPAQVVALLDHFEPFDRRLREGYEPKLESIDLREPFGDAEELFALGTFDRPGYSWILPYFYGLDWDQSEGELPQGPVDQPWHVGVPVMWDTVYQTPDGQPHFTHTAPEGVNVLYMDGHVEFVAYPGKFPASKNFAAMQRVSE